MRYPIAIGSSDEEHTWSVVVPDLPGCFANGDTLNGAIENSRKAIEAWLEFHIGNGGTVPQPKSIAEHQSDSDLSGWIWTVIDIDLSG